MFLKNLRVKKNVLNSSIDYITNPSNLFYRSWIDLSLIEPLTLPHNYYKSLIVKNGSDSVYLTFELRFTTRYKLLSSYGPFARVGMI